MFCISKCILYHYNNKLHFSNMPHYFRILLYVCALHLESLSFFFPPFFIWQINSSLSDYSSSLLNIISYLTPNFSTSVNCIFDLKKNFVSSFTVILIMCNLLPYLLSFCAVNSLRVKNSILSLYYQHLK